MFFFSGAVVLLIIGAITKSAQFPFCRWLPQAIAAPTPVSALVHSSTLVTAGVYLLIRFYSVFSDSLFALRGLLFLGGLTMLLAGLGACNEFDLKKVVAYSTLSQLGVMFVALGLGAPILAFFHLLTHAMFKAVLFLCVGICIHHHDHMQDIRFMGNLVRRLPVTQTVMLVANLALCGMPFLAGFYSKEPVLELTLTRGVGWVAMFFVMGATTLTTTYSVRSFSVTQMGGWLGSPRASGHDEDIFFLVPICILGGAAVVWGAVLNWALPLTFVGVCSPLIGLLPLMIIAVGRMIGVHLLQSRYARYRHLGVIEDAAANLWFLNTLSSHTPSQPLKLGGYFLSQVDQG